MKDEGIASVFERSPTCDEVIQAPSGKRLQHAQQLQRLLHLQRGVPALAEE